MNNRQRIGVFGGTFDPVHNTHLKIAQAAMDYAKLDRVLFVVSATPPHKSGEVALDADTRLTLVEAAVADESRMQACRLEIDRDGPSYTADTIAQLHERYPQAQLFLIIGVDSLIDLPRWYNPRGILDYAHLLVVPRPGIAAPIPPELEGHYDMLPFEVSDLSSTEIRQRLIAGNPVQDLLPAPVAAKIHEEGLYACRS